MMFGQDGALKRPVARAGAEPMQEYDGDARRRRPALVPREQGTADLDRRHRLSVRRSPSPARPTPIGRARVRRRSIVRAELLAPELARQAGRRARESAEPLGGDRLTALIADAVGAGTEPLQGQEEALGTLGEPRLTQ